MDRSLKRENGAEKIDTSANERSGAEPNEQRRTEPNETNKNVTHPPPPIS